MFDIFQTIIWILHIHTYIYVILSYHQFLVVFVHFSNGYINTTHTYIHTYIHIRDIVLPSISCRIRPFFKRLYKYYTYLYTYIHIHDIVLPSISCRIRPFFAQLQVACYLLPVAFWPIRTCMCVCMCVYTCVDLYICMYVWIYAACMCICMCTWYVRIPARRTAAYEQARTCMYTQINVHVHVYTQHTYTFMYTHKHTCTCMYKHKHTCTCMYTQK